MVSLDGPEDAYSHNARQVPGVSTKLNAFAADCEAPQTLFFCRFPFRLKQHDARRIHLHFHHMWRPIRHVGVIFRWLQPRASVHLRLLTRNPFSFSYSFSLFFFHLIFYCVAGAWLSLLCHRACFIFICRIFKWKNSWTNLYKRQINITQIFTFYQVQISNFVFALLIISQDFAPWIFILFIVCMYIHIHIVIIYSCIRKII